ncbi:MAG: VWA domain-containing protein [Acidilobus sp.]|nr:VWA domain-containing protein [Acidilobus sp.]
MYRGEKILSIAKRIAERGLDPRLNALLALDVFYTYYLPVPFVESQGESDDEDTAFRRAVISAMVRSENVWRAKTYTTADSLTSVVAAASFIERLSRLLPPSEGGQHGRESREQEEQGKGPEAGQPSVEEAAQRAAEAAMKDAEMAKKIKMVAERLGAGRGSVFSLESSAELVLKLARETDVARILEKIEGLKLPTAWGRGSTKFSKGWISGLEYGGDFERIHYSQLALPDDLFYADLANGRLLLYQKELPATRGPIYVLLDKSGSMVGSKIDWARAVTVALFKKAIDEGRTFVVRFFDSIPYSMMMVKGSSKPNDVLRVLSYLARVRAGGGTDITRAISAAVEDIGKLKLGGRERLSDVVLITDGEDRLSPEVLQRMLKAANARLHSVMIQGHNTFLQQVSYRYLAVRKLERHEALEVVDFA